jgi:hypothetical protein
MAFAFLQTYKRANGLWARMSSGKGFPPAPGHSRRPKRVNMYQNLNGWSEERASDSEAIVKAERHAGDHRERAQFAELQARTVDHLEETLGEAVESTDKTRDLLETMESEIQDALKDRRAPAAAQDDKRQSN